MSELRSNSYEPFAEQFSQSKATELLRKYPKKRPVIIWETFNDIHIDKRKFITDSNLTMGQLLYVIRKRCHLTHEDALFAMTIDSKGTPTLPLLNKTIGELYATSSVNGFLRIIISREETFGSYIFN